MNRYAQFRRGLGLALCLLAQGALWAHADLNIANVALTYPIFFTAPDGIVTEIPAGSYRIDPEGESHLRLTRLTGGAAFFITATPTTHSETLESSVALSVVVADSEQHIVLLLPDHSALDAVGNVSEITGRGITTGPLSHLQINQAMAGTQLQAQARPLGSPSFPIQDFPLAETTLNGPAVRFQWHPGAGQPVPTRYELCVVEENQLCSSASRAVVFRTLEDRAAAGTAQYELGVGLALGTGGSTGQTGRPITATEYDVPLPIRFQGKRLQWIVTACAPSMLVAGQDACSRSLPRSVVWTLPAPTLQSPGVNAAVETYRPTFRWDFPHVASADYFLICLAKPGQTCPTQPGATAQTVVERIAVFNNLQPTTFVPQADLSLLRQGSLQWTVAACNNAVGCIYQRTTRQIALAVPSAPVLLAPVTGALLSPTHRDQYQYQLELQPYQFAWQPVTGAVAYKLCLAENRERERVEQGTFVRSIYRVNTCSNGPTTSRILSIPLEYWDRYAESGYGFHWTVEACNRVEQCTTSASRPILIEVTNKNSFYWVYPVTQEPKCLTCHSMVNLNVKYQQHVTEGRFPQGTDATNRTVCAGCHSKATGFEDTWRAPAGADFSRMSIPETCNHMARHGSLGGSGVLAHLLGDDLINWAIQRIPGITFAEWEKRVRTWVGTDTRTWPQCPLP